MTHHTAQGRSGPATDRLPLPAELYLLAHNDRGRLEIAQSTLSLGLAGAYLVDLCMRRLVTLGVVWVPAAQRWLDMPGQLQAWGEVAAGGDPLLGQAFRAVRDVQEQRGGHVQTWLKLFGSEALYERVQASLIAAGILRSATVRRLGLIPTQAYLPASEDWLTGIRVRLWSVTGGFRVTGPMAEVTPQLVALCGLISALQLAPMVQHHTATSTDLTAALRAIVDRYEPTLHNVLHPIETLIGDQATAAASW